MKERLVLYTSSTKLYQKSFLAICIIVSNLGNGNRSFSGIAWYHGDNDCIIRTFDFIARSMQYT